MSLSAVVAFAVGCSDSSGTSQSGESTTGTGQELSQQTNSPKAAKPEVQKRSDMKSRAFEGRGHRGHHGPPGPDHLLRVALHELDLTDEQTKNIETALASVEPPKEAREHRGGPGKEMFAAIAAQVRAGKIDSTQILSKADSFGPPAEHQQAMVKALQTLHSTLTADQRAELVNTLSSHMKERAEKHAEFKGEGKPEFKKGFKHDGQHGPMGAMGPMGMFLEKLNLTDAQKKTIEKEIEANRPNIDHEAMKAQFESMHKARLAQLQTFASDSFDAKKFATPPQGPEGFGPKNHIEHMVKNLSTLVLILDQSQRETLAGLIEQGPKPMGHPHGEPCDNEENQVESEQ